MQASREGMFEGAGLGQAKGREAVKELQQRRKQDKEQYGGMDMLTKEQATEKTQQTKQVAGKKAYGGKVKKMAYGGKAMKMSDGKMVTKKKKTAKVAKRRGDGCAVKGKTKGRMV